MKAVGYRRSLPIDDPKALEDVELPDPTPHGRDLLVEVRAISVNPVDWKVRRRAAPPQGEVKVLGWDAAGVVRAVGADVTLFRPGVAVAYAGDLNRQGANAELHLVDERIVGRKPETLGFAEAAALPLTSLTAWELLFDRLGVAHGDGAGRTLLILGGAGGVGSILIQLARQLTGLTVVATASRPETRAWCLELGAHHVIDHTSAMPDQLRAIGITHADHVAALTGSDAHWPAIVEIVAPQGKVAVIDDPGPIDVRLLKAKSASLHWELMFTRSMFETEDMIEQHRILDAVAGLCDAGTIRTTLAEHFGRIEAAGLRRAHALLESGRARGKIVLEGL
jgi:zinc-binding alcohol dehydrogenase family protein